MTDIETYCMRLMLAIRNGLSLFLERDFTQDIKSVNYDADGLNVIMEFEGKEYRLKITPL